MQKDIKLFDKDIKLVAIDIDGTLIDDDFNISKNTVEIIKDLTKRDIAISLVTGRAYAGAKKILDKIELDLPIICHNGGKVVLGDGEIIQNKKFPISSVKEALEYGERRRFYMKAFVDDKFYVTFGNDFAKKSAENFNMRYEIIESFTKDIIEEINLFIMFCRRDISEEDLDLFKGLDVEITTSMPTVIELIPKGVSKAWGLKELKGHFNVEREEILAIGNGFNDLSMLEFAGKGIAMKNSEPLLLKNFKNISDFTNNEEGVYRILKGLL